MRVIFEIDENLDVHCTTENINLIEMDPEPLAILLHEIRENWKEHICGSLQSQVNPLVPTNLMTARKNLIQLSELLNTEEVKQKFVPAITPIEVFRRSEH